MSDAAVAAIKYVLKNQGESPIEFLHAWTYGNFDAIRKEWENVPDEVFIGADPLHPETIKQQNIQKEQSKEIADLRAELEALKNQVPSVPDEHAAFSVFFCSEMKLPANADLTQYDEAWLPWRAWRTRAALAAAPQPERSECSWQETSTRRPELEQTIVVQGANGRLFIGVYDEHFCQPRCVDRWTGKFVSGFDLWFAVPDCAERSAGDERGAS